MWMCLIYWEKYVTLCVNMFECYKAIGPNIISFFLRVPEVRIETQFTQTEKNQLNLDRYGCPTAV